MNYQISNNKLNAYLYFWFALYAGLIWMIGIIMLTKVMSQTTGSIPNKAFLLLCTLDLEMVSFLLLSISLGGFTNYFLPDLVSVRKFLLFGPRLQSFLFFVLVICFHSYFQSYYYLFSLLVDYQLNPVVVIIIRDYLELFETITRISGRGIVFVFLALSVNIIVTITDSKEIENLDMYTHPFLHIVFNLAMLVLFTFLFYVYVTYFLAVEHSVWGILNVCKYTTHSLRPMQVLMFIGILFQVGYNVSQDRIFRYCFTVYLMVVAFFLITCSYNSPIYSEQFYEFAIKWDLFQSIRNTYLLWISTIIVYYFGGTINLGNIIIYHLVIELVMLAHRSQFTW